MEKRQKDLLRPLVAELRRTLAGAADGSVRGDLDRELERLGFAPTGTILPLDALSRPSKTERRAYEVAAAELGGITNLAERMLARAALVERAAYGWANRLLAIRVLEARGLIDGTLRANPEYDGLSEALYGLRLSSPERAAGADGGWWAVVEDACNAQAASLPGLFALDTGAASGPHRSGSGAGQGSAPTHTLHDAAIALRPSTGALVSCIALLGGGAADTRRALDPAALAELDAAFADPDAIGWAYQFYQIEAKNQVYARLKLGKKVTTRDEIAAATQLFTEPYMVQWLLQNSLGRSYHELYPDSVLPDQWPYYIRPETREIPAISSLAELTLIDPCMGSGHFLREAFDMFVAMYREREPNLGAAAIADRVLAEHLHGIDIDPRAAQLAAFTLYARAWELVRDERRQQHLPRARAYAPSSMNLATSPGRIPSGALQRHLRRHPEDRRLESLLAGIFTALESADTLGCLLRPREHLAAAVAELRKAQQTLLGFDADALALNQAIETVLATNPDQLENVLLDRVAASFAADARGADDVGALLFGQAAERGVRLLQLLDHRYAVVVTNPPYMGSKNMDDATQKYVEKHYVSGKRDLYAAFILRNLELCLPYGRVSMVTQQSWMFLSSFAELRAVPEDRLTDARQRKVFAGLLRETRLETLAHLGEYAFEDTAAAGAFAAMFVTANTLPAESHWLVALRLVGLKSADEKASALRRSAIGGLNFDAGPSATVFHLNQQAALSVPRAPILYSLPPSVLSAMQDRNRTGRFLSSVNGSRTGNNSQFIRLYWEVPYTPTRQRWMPYAKGGGPARWLGNDEFVIDWSSGAVWCYRNSHIGRCTEEQYWERAGLSFNKISRGNLTVRFVQSGISDYGGPVLTAKDEATILAHLAMLNTQLCSYIVFQLSPSFNTEIGDVLSIPLGSAERRFDDFASLAEVSLGTKRLLLVREPTSREYEPSYTTGISDMEDETAKIGVWLSLFQGLTETIILEALDIEWSDLVSTDIGIPLAFYPLVSRDQHIPSDPQSQQKELGRLQQLVADHVAGSVANPLQDLSSLKQRLAAAYVRGRSLQHEMRDETDEGQDDPIALDARLPVPTTTLLEDLSQDLQIHPISVYWLLQEIRAEGARCKPEELRLLEDRLSVLVLRLLGHRWPRQLEAGEPVPDWADADGIIPLLPGLGETPLAERVRERLRAEDGNLGAQQTEALLQELAGQDLATWLRRRFFDRHIRQFKYRPIAWHLASTPGNGGGKRKGSGRTPPAFECLVYYHKSGVEMLARIRTQYVGPLIHAERARRDAARLAGGETAAAQSAAKRRPPSRRRGCRSWKVSAKCCAGWRRAASPAPNLRRCWPRSHWTAGAATGSARPAATRIWWPGNGPGMWILTTGCG